MQRFFKKNKLNYLGHLGVRHLKSNLGFLVLEVIIASAIITAIVLATTSVTQKFVSLSHRSLKTSQASFLLEEGAEAVRIHRDNAWSNISNMSGGVDYYPVFFGGTWTFSTTPSTIDGFARKVSVSAVSRDNTTQDIVTSGGTNDPNTKFITVTVSWNEEGQVSTKTISFYLSNIFL